MEHNVFISYSSNDKAVADAIVSNLESRGIRCWYAPRDIPQGEDWASAISDAISHSQIMLLVFSKDANRAHRVLDELKLALSEKIKVLPFRIENIDPSGEMRLYLASPQWLDAFSPSWKSHLNNLVETVERMLDAKQAGGEKLIKDGDKIGLSSIRGLLGENKKIVIAAVVAGFITISLVVLGLAYILGLFSGSTERALTPVFSQVVLETEMPTLAPTAFPQPTTTLSPTSEPTPIPSATLTPESFIKSIDETTGWDHYDYYQDGFAISIPPSWVAFNLNAEDFTMMLDLFENTNPELAEVYTSDAIQNMIASGIKFMAIDASQESMGSGNPTNMNLLIADLPLDIDLRAYIDLTLGQLKQMLGENIQITEKTVYVSGIEAVRLTYSTFVNNIQGNPQEVQFIQYIFLDGRTQVILTFTVNKGLYPANISLIEDIVESFEYIQ